VSGVKIIFPSGDGEEKKMWNSYHLRSPKLADEMFPGVYIPPGMTSLIQSLLDRAVLSGSEILEIVGAAESLNVNSLQMEKFPSAEMLFLKVNVPNWGVLLAVNTRRSKEPWYWSGNDDVEVVYSTLVELMGGIRMRALRIMMRDLFKGDPEDYSSDDACIKRAMEE
jgi:hypothetical protein